MNDEINIFKPNKLLAKLCTPVKKQKYMHSWRGKKTIIWYNHYRSINKPIEAEETKQLK